MTTPLLFFALLQSSLAMDLRSSTSLSDQPMSSEIAWRLSTHKINAHQTRWQVERKVSLEEVKGEELKDGRFGIRAGALRVQNLLWVRPENSPWFVKKFPCGFAGEAHLDTYEHSLDRARQAAQEWERILRAALPKLRRSMAALRTDSAKGALDKGQRVYRAWAGEAEQLFLRQEVKLRRGRTASLRRKYARACTKTKPATPKLQAFLTPLKKQEEADPWLRLPARRWDGLFSVRMLWKLGSLKLSGQFLLDPNSEHNLVSPSWLRLQGVSDKFIEKVAGQPKLVTWNGKTKAARSYKAMIPTLGGKVLRAGDFYLLETQVRLPPKHLAICCDGVLGREFFRRFVVGFEPGDFNRVQIFHGGEFDSKEPFEVLALRETTRGLETPCGKKGLTWLAPPGGRLSQRKGLRCQGLPLFEQVPLWVQGDRLGLDISEVVGKRRVVVDLPMGRLFVHSGDLQRKLYREATGLRLGFTYDQYRERELKVLSIDPKGGANRAFERGLRKGMRIDRLLGREVGELDQWEVDQYLKGRREGEFTLQWSMSDRAVIAPIRVTRGL